MDFYKPFRQSFTTVSTEARISPRAKGTNILVKMPVDSVSRYFPEEQATYPKKILFESAV